MSEPQRLCFVPCSRLGVGPYPLPLGLSLSLVRLGAGSRHRGLRLALGQLRQERVLGLEEVSVNKQCRPTSDIRACLPVRVIQPK